MSKNQLSETDSSARDECDDWSNKQNKATKIW